MAGATTLASFLILLTIVSGIGNYGAEGILRYSFPVFELSRKAQLPFVLLSFALLFSATWLSQVLVATGFFYYLLAEGAADPASRRTIVPGLDIEVIGVLVESLPPTRRSGGRRRKRLKEKLKG